MIRQSQNIAATLLITLFIITLTPAISLGEAVATLTFVRGKVDVLKKGEKRARLVKKGAKLVVGDIVRTKSQSRAQISFIDESKVNMAQNSRVEIKEFSYKPEKKERKSLLRTFRGKIRALIPRFLLGDDSKFEVETPTAVAAVRGTDFFSVVKKLPFESEVLVIKGKVAVKNMDPSIVGEVFLTPGKASKIGKGRPPQKARPFTKKEIRRLIKETDPLEKDVKPPKPEDPLTEEPKKIEPPVTPPITETAPSVNIIFEFP
ncbi:MAG: FecR family protein [Deltaproteobacteria bacterium]|nr:FecR family protein [Deltaproteobacteria bacterium]